MSSPGMTAYYGPNDQQTTVNSNFFIWVPAPRADSGHNKQFPYTLNLKIIMPYDASHYVIYN